MIDRLNTVQLWQECGYDGGADPRTLWAFADDTTVTGFNVPAVQRLLSIAHSAFEEISLQLNAGKTKRQEFMTAGQAPGMLQLAGQALAPTGRYEFVRYLGLF